MSHNPSAQLKHLQVTRTKMIEDLEDARLKQKALESQVRHLENDLGNVDAEIKKMTESVVVSEHAMLRYFERVMGFNLAEIQAKILPDSVVGQVLTLRNGTFPVGNNGSSFRLRVRDGVVVTVTTREEQPH